MKKLPILFIMILSTVSYSQVANTPVDLILCDVDNDGFSEFDLESQTAEVLGAKNIIKSKFSPDGYNIGMNCGETSGQTVMHFHCHVIPRYKGDMDNPRGGIRHCIYGKGYY